MNSAKQKQRLSADGAGYEQYHPPWAEWNDHLVNNVKWGGKLSSTSSPSSSPVEGFGELFEDPAGLVNLPSDIAVESWIRPFQINPPINLVLEPESAPLELLNFNRHLVKFKIMRMIMGSIMCLEREAIHRPFPVEFQSDDFVATGGYPWKPWYHVYCNTKAGKDNPHVMRYSHYGKYLVRLFYMGKWRCLVVDDRFPINEEGLLLPMSRPGNLWLAILTKALLRVASLSWQPDDHSSVDFSVIHCLTGWIPTIVPRQFCTNYEAWCICCNVMSSNEDVVRQPGCYPTEHDFQCPEDNSLEGLSASPSRAIFSVVLHPNLLRPRQEFATSITNLEYIILISQVQYNSELPRSLWKEYRWKEWAYNKGIITDNTDKPKRKVKIFNPLKTSVWQQADTTEEREFWTDFDNFIKCVRYIEVYYKPSYFKYSLRAWSVPEIFTILNVAKDEVEKRNRSPSKQGRRSSKSPKAKTIKSEKSVSKSSTKNRSKITNESNKSSAIKTKKIPSIDVPANVQTQPFFYLLIDSMVCKQLCICLSAYDSGKPSYAHLIMGKFEWHSPSVAPIVFMLSTSGTKGHMLSLTPGLHVFRIWHSFPEHFCCQIFCNTLFSTGSKMYIQQVLTNESSTYTFYGNLMSTGFEQLLSASEGGADHGKAYNQFMSCLLPVQLTKQLPWPKWFIVYTELLQAFEESLTEMLADSTQIPEEVYLALNSYKKLFLNTVFGCKSLMNYNIDYYNYYKEKFLSARYKEMEEELKEKHKRQKSPKSMKIKRKQSSKKSEPSVTTKKTKTIHKEKGDKKGKAVHQGTPLRTLLQCKEKSLLLGDYRNNIILLKKMMTKVPHIRQLYPFKFEDDRRIVFRDYSGNVKIKENWVILVRCILNIHSMDPVPCSLHFWAPIHGLVMNLIDNDTHQEVPLGFVENNVANLSQNQEGYTLIVYGEANSSAVSWKLRCMGVAEENLLHVCEGPNCRNPRTQLPEQDNQTVRGYYLPNKERIICRCLLEVFTDTTVLLKLRLSNRFAFSSFIIWDHLGNAVLKTTGIGYILIPILKLKGMPSEMSVELPVSRHLTTRSRSYRVEVRLLDDSWPLNMDQIKAMLYYKENLPDIHFVLNEIGADQSNFLLHQRIIEDTDYEFFKQVETPTWSITVVADLKKEMPVRLSHDISVFHKVQLLKAKWSEEGLDLTQCHRLREDILKKLSETSVEDWSEDGVFNLKAKRTDQLTELYRKPSSVDLKSADTEVSELSLVEGKASINNLSLTSSLPPALDINNKTTKLNSEPSLQTLSIHSSQSNVSKTSEIMTTPADSLPNIDKNEIKTVMIQQTKIHKALEKLRIKNMGNVQQLLDEANQKRIQFINDRKAAIYGESKKRNTKDGNKNYKKSPSRK